MINPQDFAFRLRREGSDYTLTTPAISLVSRSSDLADAETRLRSFLVEIHALSQQRGLELLTPSEATLKGQADENDPKAISRTIRRVMMAALFVSIASVPVLWAGQQMVSAWTELKARVGSPTQAVTLLSSGVHGFADLVDQITPERRDQLTRDLSRITIGLEPYAAEVRPLWLGSSQDRDAIKSRLVPPEGRP